MKSICTFRLSEEAQRRLIEIAGKNGISRAAVIELMIREYTSVAAIVHKGAVLPEGVNP